MPRPSPQQWRVLNRWATEFEEREGRKPKVWLDKACINQQKISESLAGLPIYLSGCQEMVVLMGETYLSRLWWVQMFHCACSHALTPMRRTPSTDKLVMQPTFTMYTLWTLNATDHVCAPDQLRSVCMRWYCGDVHVSLTPILDPPTYLPINRCIMEIYTFFRMGGSVERIVIIPVKQSQQKMDYHIETFRAGK